MLKLILKNLWSRRRSNAWLFAELIIVTILSWIILDEAIVSLHDINANPGYDVDRLVNIDVETMPLDSPEFDKEAFSVEGSRQVYDNLLSKARNLPDVESLVREYSGIDGRGSMTGPLFTGNEAIDTVAPYAFMMNVKSDSKILSTYGIETTEDSPSVEEIESKPLGENDIIITESIDRYYWPDRRGIRDKYFINKYSPDSTHINVVGIIKDLRFRSYVRTPAVAIQGSKIYDGGYYNRTTLILRLKDGVDVDGYIHENIDRITKDLRIGNFFVRSVMGQKQQIKDYEYDAGVSGNRSLMLFVAALFLINLIVGVTGCVWLQTGKRIPELGVLRSFGALKSQTVKMLIGESTVLATVAFIIGDLIYLQYALANGLSNGFEGNDMYFPDNSWVNNFGEHFVIVSLIVYAVIVLCAVIGTYFPARHVSKIEPVDALRDE